MSDTDSFIDEVTEEVRRDRLFAMFRRYGWIAVLAVVLIVGAAAWNEVRKARAQSQAQALGDALIAALDGETSGARAGALSSVTATTPGGNAVVDLALAAAQADAGQPGAAIATLENLAADGDIPEVYRQIAGFKALLLRAGREDTPDADLRTGFSALASPGAPLRLLAEEQLALLDLRAGDTGAAIDRFQAILSDAGASTDLQQRAAQAIVALGGEPELQPGPQG